MVASLPDRPQDRARRLLSRFTILGNQEEAVEEPQVFEKMISLLTRKPRIWTCQALLRLCEVMRTISLAQLAFTISFLLNRRRRHHHHHHRVDDLLLRLWRHTCQVRCQGGCLRRRRRQALCKEVVVAVALHHGLSEPGRDRTVSLN